VDEGAFHRQLSPKKDSGVTHHDMGKCAAASSRLHPKMCIPQVTLKDTETRPWSRSSEPGSACRLMQPEQPVSTAAKPPEPRFVFRRLPSGDGMKEAEASIINNRAARQPLDGEPCGSPHL